MHQEATRTNPMSVDHKRPLFAFFVITLACALFMGYSLRAQGMVDVLHGNPVVGSAVAAGVTLDVLRSDPADFDGAGGVTSPDGAPADADAPAGVRASDVVAPAGAATTVPLVERPPRADRAAKRRATPTVRTKGTASTRQDARSAPRGPGRVAPGHLRGTVRTWGVAAKRADGAKGHASQRGTAQGKRAHAKKRHGKARARSARARR